AQALDSQDTRAREGRLGVHLVRCQRALEAGDYDLARGMVPPLKTLDAGKVHAAEIDALDRRARGIGRWQLPAEPRGAAAAVPRLDEHCQPAGTKDRGRTPILPQDIEMGNYLVRLSLPGHAEVRYPMCIGRDQVEGEAEACRVRLIPAGEVPE